MKNFKYEGLSSNGAKIEGIVEAFDEAEALVKAKENCRIVNSVTPISAASGVLNADIGQLLNGGKITDKELSLLCSQMSIELKAGLPIVKSLRLNAENEKNTTLKNILSEVADDVQAGHGLADSFEVRGPKLPKSFIETIRAGEESGRLDDCFDKLKTYYENQAGVKSKVVGALIYPILLICVAVVVVFIIMIFAVPVFKDTFASMGNTLPGVTQALINMSDFFTNYWYIVIIVIVAIAVAIKLFKKTDTGARLSARLALTFPGLGGVTRMSAASNFASTLQTMLLSGLPLVKSLDITENVMTNLLIAEDINAAKMGVTEGKRLGDGLEKSEWFPQLLKEMTSVGEETGNLEETLGVVNEYYTKEVDTAVQRALGILNPAITMVLAAIVVFILLAVYLPLFGMYGSI